ncbi:apical membrane antigen AMA1 [Toxoplasma gondii GAB2-2007-GAL-DOM2]|uniref:Apical membrane antigen AMA1 n=6 Tax=Toxoplasma gondii TaxID=5811 RepID=S7WI53_TOXGG|nr:apical membrane antigen AMA1 [Toxoplasma gondii GT1]KAF4641558.1 apical membrane antigen AMA1 [Toxoplasma gondii]KFG30064.1 apical membrane antigen AMA1 [Toxoplasma gondii GAB2-2007-GAL-DOM2]KFG36978.1 apical membrane antigen AMA1 [Toxoplasma gondii FOU]PUA85771.1 apical membrane antigen AMA1 [Toxoplasma gondii TgCATBr9]RQX68167.1 apical membrane antigen AMA1 [Toxoplasma gondii CAST]
MICSIMGGLRSLRAARPYSHQSNTETKHMGLVGVASLLVLVADCTIFASGLSSSTRSRESQTLSASTSGNPFQANVEMKTFMERFNLTHHHQSGIYVDLGQDKEVDGTLYREPAGLCPIWGKHIELQQPDRPPYRNNFLEDVPTEKEYKQSGNPLPGGFNLNFVTPSGQRISPFPMELLEKNSNIKASTDLGRCAEFAFKTVAMDKNNKATKYRYPFVYDSKKRLCHILYVSMQLMEGKKYCSVKGEPPDLTWYCFKPRKSVTENHHLIYGSAYVGENPDAFLSKCPNQALRGYRFGVWKKGRCLDYTELTDTVIERVESKAQCWVKTFENDGVASDQPHTYPLTSQASWNDWWPLHQSDQPHSGGVGRNYGFYYVDTTGEGKCALSDQVPDCLVSDSAAVSYTAAGSLSEETPNFIIPSNPSVTPPTPETALQCTADKFPDSFGACDVQACKRQKTSCVGGQIQSTSVDCTADEQNECGSNTALIAGLAVGGVLLLALLGGGCYFAKRLDRNKGVQAAHHEHEFQSDRGARKKRPSDLMQEAEPSFWDEAEENIEQDGETHVMVEGDY